MLVNDQCCSNPCVWCLVGQIDIHKSGRAVLWVKGIPLDVSLYVCAADISLLFTLQVRTGVETATFQEVCEMNVAQKSCYKLATIRNKLVRHKS